MGVWRDYIPEHASLGEKGSDGNRAIHECERSSEWFIGAATLLSTSLRRTSVYFLISDQRGEVSKPMSIPREATSTKKMQVHESGSTSAAFYQATVRSLE
jgi:hypothetical protein